MTKLTLKVITQILDENGNPVKSSSCSAPLGDVDEFDHEAKKMASCRPLTALKNKWSKSTGSQAMT